MNTLIEEPIEELELTEKQRRRKLWEKHKGPRTKYWWNIGTIPQGSNIPAANDFTTPSKNFIVVPM